MILCDEENMKEREIIRQDVISPLWQHFNSNEVSLNNNIYSALHKFLKFSTIPSDNSHTNTTILANIYIHIILIKIITKA